eukprot:7615229-Pyramimonas_sp.AAC.1
MHVLCRKPYPVYPSTYKSTPLMGDSHPPIMNLPPVRVAQMSFSVYPSTYESTPLMMTGDSHPPIMNPSPCTCGPDVLPGVPLRLSERRRGGALQRDPRHTPAHQQLRRSDGDGQRSALRHLPQHAQAEEPQM